MASELRHVDDFADGQQEGLLVIEGHGCFYGVTRFLSTRITWLAASAAAGSQQCDWRAYIYNERSGMIGVMVVRISGFARRLGYVLVYN
jgi:hypothetical protein